MRGKKNASIPLLSVAIFAVIGASFAADRPASDADIWSSLKKNPLVEKTADNFEIWDEVVDRIVAKKDAAMLKVVLTIPAPSAGMPAESYRADLFKILRADPRFLISTANEVYRGNSDCVLRWLVVPHNQAVPFWRLVSVLDEIKGDPLVTAFLARANEIRADDSRLRSSACGS